jgi:hypothetical protein
MNANSMFQPSLAQQAQNLQLQQIAANLPNDVRQAIANNYRVSEVSVLPLPYWSKIRFAATLAAGPPVVATVAAGTRKAFSYAQGQLMTQAGFPDTYGTATAAETNLLRAQETRDNADYWIWGIRGYVTQDSDPVLAAAIFSSTNVDIALNGTQQIPLGRLEMFPAGGGLYGAAPSALKIPAISESGSGADGGAGAIVPFLSNGNPVSNSFYRLQQPFKWAAVGSAGSDSSLNISASLQRSVAVTCALARAAAAGVAPYTPPSTAGAAGTFVDIVFELIGVGVSKRSPNV